MQRGNTRFNNEHIFIQLSYSPLFNTSRRVYFVLFTPSQFLPRTHLHLRCGLGKKNISKSVGTSSSEIQKIAGSPGPH